MANVSNLTELKLVLREKDVPFFDDDELNSYVTKNNGNFSRTAHECLIVKSQNTTVSIPGLSVADSSAYFLRLASMYRQSNSGVLKGVY